MRPRVPSDEEFAALSAGEQRELGEALSVWLRFGDPASFAATVSGGRFETPPHVRLISEYLVALAEGEIRKLMIFAPPRHGKSELVSKFMPAWFLSQFPDRRVMLTAYEAEFAASWGRKARDVIEGHPELGVRVSRRSSAANRWDLEGHEGGMVTAGMGGALTGKGAHLLIIDDPIKNMEDAQSKAVKDSQWDWARSTALTRLEPGGGVALMLTRWNEDDIAGRFLEEEPDEWTVLSLPALAEEDDALGRAPGEALWPERYDASVLEGIRSSSGSYVWAALYQQRPRPELGGLFRADKLKYWRWAAGGRAFNLDGQFVDVKDTVRVATVDLAISQRTSADWSVVATFAITRTDPAMVLLIDLVRKRLEAPDHLPTIREAFRKHDHVWVGVEKATFGSALLQEAARRRAADVPGVGIPFRELVADKDKFTRALAAAARVEAGQFWLPAEASWLDVVEQELLGFPNGKHDDVVDCVAYACLELGKRSFFKAPRREPSSMEERIAAKVSGRSRRGSHPVLGRW